MILHMARISVRLQPRASKAAIVGFREDGVLLVRVPEPPLDGRANRALCRLVAERLGIAPSKVTVMRGHTGRDKVLEIEGDDAAVRSGLRTP